MPTLNSAIKPTNFVEAPALSALFGAKIIFADETKQHTGSFKFRAAYNVASKVENKHILAASSGNFALALSYACSLLGKRCTIVMPANSAQVKIDGIKKYGGQIEFVDTAVKNRNERLAELAKDYPDAYVTNAYDNPLIIEGNRSLGEEIAAYTEKFDYIISPVGGGGLISGIISGIKNLQHPDEYNSNKKNVHNDTSVKNNEQPTIIGAEPALANDAARSLLAGELIANEIEPQTIADGARTISLGKHNWEILRNNLKQIIEVPEKDIKTVGYLSHPASGISMMSFFKHLVSNDPQVVQEALADPLIRKKLLPRELIKTLAEIKRTSYYAQKLEEDIPILVIQGSDDKCVSAASVAKLAKNIKSEDQTIRWFYAYGHLAFETSHLRAPILDALIKWFREHRPEYKFALEEMQKEISALGGTLR